MRFKEYIKEATLPKRVLNSLKKKLYHIKDWRKEEIMPVIPFGRNIGGGKPNDCHGNAVKYNKQTGADVYIGYVIAKDEDGWFMSEHSFNVVDGKVIETTPLENYDEIYYIGVKVPKNEFTKYRYVNNADKISWIKKQMKKF